MASDRYPFRALANRLARIGLYPEVDGEPIGRIQAGRLGNPHVVVDPVKIKTFADSAGSKGSPILKRTNIGPDGVQRVPFSMPPTDQARRRGRAGSGGDCQARVGAEGRTIGVGYLLRADA